MHGTEEASLEQQRTRGGIEIVTVSVRLRSAIPLIEPPTWYWFTINRQSCNLSRSHETLQAAAVHRLSYGLVFVFLFISYILSFVTLLAVTHCLKNRSLKVISYNWKKLDLMMSISGTRYTEGSSFWMHTWLCTLPRAQLPYVAVDSKAEVTYFHTSHFYAKKHAKITNVDSSSLCMRHGGVSVCKLSVRLRMLRLLRSWSLIART